MSNNGIKLVSIVIPVYNESVVLAELMASLDRVVQRMPYKFEIIVVDDGSTDGTRARLQGLRADHPELRVISLSRNFGHQSALLAGLHHAQGDCVITMDGDLQHPPELIPELIVHWREGAQIVNTRRADLHGSLFKRWTSKLFYRVFRWLSGLRLQPGMADFRLLDRRVVDAVRQMDESAMFLRGALQWAGFDQAVVDYEVQPRAAGQTKYTLRRMLGLALEGLTSFSALPLRLATLLGFIFSAVSFAYLAYAVVIWATTDQAVPGWTSVIGSVLFLGGIQLICLGIIGEYVGKIFVETKRRPAYLIKDTLGFGDDQATASTVRHLDLGQRPGSGETGDQ